MTEKIIFLVILLSASTAAGLIIGKLIDFTDDDDDDPITNHMLSQCNDPAKAGEKEELLKRNK